LSTNNPIQIAVEQSKAIEQLLTSKFEAVGKGLTEKTKSIEYNLPVGLANKIKTIARIRNNVVHEDGSLLKNENQFVQSCQAIKTELSDLTKFKPQLKSVLEVVAHDKDFKVFYKHYCEDNRVEQALTLLISLFVGFVFAADIHPIMFIWGVVLSIGVLTVAHKWLVKQKWSPLIYKFYRGKFTVDSPSVDGNPVNEVLYQEVKNVSLVDDDKNILAIRSYNRGVSEEFKLHLVGSSQSAKQICQQIHELVFRTSGPSYSADAEYSSHEEDQRNSHQKVAGVAGFAGTAYLLSQNNDETAMFADETSMFAEVDALSEAPSVNPANGLPMVGAVDIEGNPFGTDAHDNGVTVTDAIGFGDSIADSFDSSDSFSSFDSSDSFSSFDSFDNQY